MKYKSLKEIEAAKKELDRQSSYLQDDPGSMHTAQWNREMLEVSQAESAILRKKVSSIKSKKNPR